MKKILRNYCIGAGLCALLAPLVQAQVPVERGLLAGLEADASHLLDTGGNAIVSGANVGTWTDGAASFMLANNPAPGDGPVYIAPAHAEFDASKFGGKGYLWFEAPASLDTADPGDALYSTEAYLTPEATAPVAGHVFMVLAPAFTVDRGDIIGTRTADPVLGTLNGFFVEPRLLEGNAVERFWNGNPGGAGGYEGTISAYSGTFNNDGSTAYILEWQSIASNDEDGARAFYLNGEKIGEDTDSGIVPEGVAAFGIGGSPDNPNSLNGYVAAVYIYGVELTDAERAEVGTYLQANFGIDGAYTVAEMPPLPVTRGLAALLTAEESALLNTSGEAISVGANVGTWMDGTIDFTLAANPAPGDGPVYVDQGEASFDAGLFNGNGYLLFSAPASLDAADPGDALYSSEALLTPVITAPVRGSVFMVLAPSITIDRGDLFGTRTSDAVLGSSNGFFVEPRFDDTTEVQRFWNGNPGGAGGYAGDLALFSGDFVNDRSAPYILEWRSITSSDQDGHRSFYVNGEWIGEDTESTIVPYGVGGFGIGGTLDNPNSLDGAVAAFLVFEEELTEAERQQVGAWLQDVYGVAGTYAAPEAPSGNSILIDFGKAALTSGGETTTWNDIVPPVEGNSSLTGTDMSATTFPYILAPDLLDAAGNSTGVQLVFDSWSVPEGVTANGNGIAGMEVAGELPATGYPESATVDSWFVNNGAIVALALDGLDPALAYDLYMFGTSSATDVRISAWRVRGSIRYLLTDGNTDEFAVFEGVVPDSEGRIIVEYSHAAEGRPQGQWSTLEIVPVEQPVTDVLDGRVVAGMRHSPWFGSYTAYEPAYVLTDEELWFYLGGNDANSLWMYSYDTASWWWSSRVYWPNVYNAADGEWYYLWSNGNGAFLYRYSDASWTAIGSAE